MNIETFSKELKENSGMKEIPEDLMKLIDFQINTSQPEYYSQGFSLFCDNYSNALETWSEEKEFLSRLYPFATANGTGSFYCIWDDRSGRSLNEMPIVVFGDEGGVGIVAENLRQLFHLLSYDIEVSVDWESIYFYKDDDDYEANDDLELYLGWLKDNFGFDQISEPDEIIKTAQEKYQAAFADWLKRYYKE